MENKSFKALLIEDSLFATRHTQKMLAEAKTDQFDVELKCAGQLSVGLEHLVEGGIDIVLLDLTLPDSDELHTFTKVYSQAPDIPIVVLTGLEDEKLAIEAVKKGAQDYLIKGQLDSRSLKRSILYAIERGRTAEELKKYREHLEELVEERTAKLEKTNVRLKKEITVRKRVEKNLRKAYARLKKQSMLLVQTEKMSAIGTLVAGVAHELNNPMMGILHFAQYCIKTTPENERMHSILQDIENETRRCIDIVNNLLTFSHMENGEKEEYQKESCNVALERVLKLLSYRIERMGVSIINNIDEDTPPIWMKINSIQEVFLNLITNALDALEESKKKEITINVRREGEYEQISIADSGGGIASENLQSIFDPFFTTKAVGKGTGLGLSLCQSIIKAHGGEITCESKSNEGTKLKISLPIERRKREEEKR